MSKKVFRLTTLSAFFVLGMSTMAFAEADPTVAASAMKLFAAGRDRGGIRYRHRGFRYGHRPGHRHHKAPWKVRPGTPRLPVRSP